MPEVSNKYIREFTELDKELINKIKEDNLIAHAQKHYSSDLNLDAYYKFFTERSEKISELSRDFTDPDKIKEIFDSKYREIALNIAGKIKMYEDEINNKQKKHTPEAKENLKEKLIEDVKSTYISKFIPAFKSAEVEAEKMLSEAENARYPTMRPEPGNRPDPIWESYRAFMRELRQITSEEERGIRVHQWNDLVGVLGDPNRSRDEENLARNSIDLLNNKMLASRVAKEKEQKFLEYRDYFREEAKKQFPQNEGDISKQIRNIYEKHCREMVDDPNFYENIPNPSIENALNKAKLEAIIDLLRPMPEPYQQRVKANLYHIENSPLIKNKTEMQKEFILAMQNAMETRPEDRARWMNDVNELAETAVNSPNESERKQAEYSMLPLAQEIGQEKVKWKKEQKSKENHREIHDHSNSGEQSNNAKIEAEKIPIDAHPIPEDIQGIMETMPESHQQHVKANLSHIQNMPEILDSYKGFLREVVQMQPPTNEIIMERLNGIVGAATYSSNHREQLKNLLDATKKDLLAHRLQLEQNGIDKHPIPEEMQGIMAAMPESHQQHVKANLSHIQNMPEILDSYKGFLREVVQMQPPTNEIIMERLNGIVGAATYSSNHREQLKNLLDATKKDLLAHRLHLENDKKLQEHGIICGKKIEEITPQAASEETKQEIAKIINDSYNKIERECSALAPNELNEYDYSKFQKSLDLAIEDVNVLIQEEIDKHPIPEDMQNMPEADKQLVQTSLRLLQKTSPDTQDIYKEAIREVMQIPNHERDERIRDVNSFARMAVDPTLQPHERKQAEYLIDEQKNRMLEARVQRERNHSYEQYKAIFEAAAKDHTPNNADESTKKEIKKIFNFYLEEPKRLYQSLPPKELSEGNYSEYLKNLSTAKAEAKETIQFEINRNVKKALENLDSCTPFTNAIIDNFSADAQKKALKERAFEKGGLIEKAVQRREKISEIADHFDITSKQEIKKLSDIIDEHGSPLQRLSNAAQKLSNGGQKLMNSVQKTVSKVRR